MLAPPARAARETWKAVLPVLAALIVLPGCIEFPEGEAYVCSGGEDADEDECPRRSVCVDGVCRDEDEAEPALACRSACRMFHECGLASECQATSCGVAFLLKATAEECTTSCTQDSEGFDTTQLRCLGGLTCEEDVDLCFPD